MPNQEMNPMKNAASKPKFRFRLILPWILLIILLIGAGLGYYFYNKKVNNNKQVLQTQIDNLKKQLDEQKALTNESSDTSTTTDNNNDQASTCPVATFTNEEQLTMEGWQTYEMADFGYTFKAPQDWELFNQVNDIIVLKSDGITLEMRSGEASLSELESYHLTETKDTEIACTTATSNYLSGNAGIENARAISTHLTKNGQEHKFVISYEDQGASLSSDIIEAYNLILKTITFS